MTSNTQTATLTTTQHSAYGELKRRGALVASRYAFGPAGRTFSQRTLDALVDAGLARSEVVRGVPGAPAVAVGIVPIDAPPVVDPPVREGYHAAEVAGVLVPDTHPGEAHYRLKITNGIGGETKWLTVPDHVVHALRAILANIPA